MQNASPYTPSVPCFAPVPVCFGMGPLGPLWVCMVPAPQYCGNFPPSLYPPLPGPDYVTDEEPDADDEQEEGCAEEEEMVVAAPPTLPSTPVPIRIIDDKPSGPEAAVAVVDKVETRMRQTGDTLPAPIGWGRPRLGKGISVSPLPTVKNVIASKVIEVYPRVSRKTQAQRIEESDGNDLPEEPPAADTTDLDCCQKCQQRAPHRPGMRYCANCFHALPYCRNYKECGLRTDNKEHGYCNTCYYQYRQVCVECRTHFYFDDSGLCQTCTQKAEPIKRGQCHNWWLTDDGQHRQVCRAVCSRQRRFCRECWLALKSSTR